MQDNRRLIDEALEHEPIKNTFRLAWEFIRLNQKFTLIAMGLFIVLNLLGGLPLMGTLFMVFAGVFGMMIQIHVGKMFYGTDKIETYVATIEDNKIENVIKQHIQVAFGAYMGLIVLLLITLVLVGIIGGATGLIHEGMDQMALVMALATLGLPILFISLLLSYVQPLVHSNIVLANDFSEGFKAVFSIFSLDVWRSAFQKPYFNYVAIFGLVLIGVVFAMVAVTTLLMMIPFVNILGNILMMGFMYVFMVIISIGAMMARRLVEV